tara:strand:+ start:28818 stop:29033 length:216 start_codon:yes stop_codon:yes gene_type:complete
MNKDMEFVIINIILNDCPDERGTNYDYLMKRCAEKGYTDEDLIDNTLYYLCDKNVITEPIFGWFKINEELL